MREGTRVPLRRKLICLITAAVSAPVGLAAATTTTSPTAKTLLVLEQSYDVAGSPALLVAVDLTRGRVRRLASVARTAYGFGAWSPDGSTLAIANLSGHIVLVDAGSGAQRILPVLAAKPRTRQPLSTAAWAPDGRSLAIVDGGSSVVVRATNGKLIRTVARAVDPNHSVAKPTWSPDGRWIGFERLFSGGVDGRGCCTDTYRIVPATGGIERRVLTIHDGGIHDSPYLSWSPDATRIAFTTEARNPHDAPLAVVNVRTRVVRRLASNAFLAVPGWAPDGEHLTMRSTKGIEVLDMDTGATTPVPVPKGGAAVYAPDGRLLAVPWERPERNHGMSAGVEVVNVPGMPHRPALVVVAPKGFAVTATGWSSE
jgi:Tol biopolymer transport system component